MGKENVEDIYPLSPMQEGMLFHALSSPKSRLYFQQYSYTLQGNLNAGAFQKAWELVTDRHPALRTLFITWERHKKPLQLVRQHVELPWILNNWSEVSSDEIQKRIEELLQTDRAKGFDLSQAPLMRFTLIQLNNNTHLFIWSWHHLLMDGWSVALVLKEVMSYYDAFCNGNNISFNTPHPYRDYISWHQKQDISAAEKFWRSNLKGFTAPTSLRRSKLEQEELSDTEESFDRYKLIIPDTIATALQLLTKRHRLTLNTIVQGAWALLLSQYSREKEVVFGATVSGRSPELAGIEDMIGVFINTLPVRVKTSPEDSLISWLQSLQNQLIEMRKYEYSPLVEIQRWSEIPRDQQLFESILVFENYPIDISEEHEKSIRILKADYFEQTNYPLTILVMPGHQIEFIINYNTNQFTSDLIKQISIHFQVLLETIAGSPEVPVSKLSPLTDQERRQLLYGFNDTYHEFSGHLCVQELFELQVEQHPHKIAAIFDNVKLTYIELNQKANQVARYLQNIGVGTEVMVAVCLERTSELLVSLLGILKAGGAYIPLDPAYPAERLGLMLADSQATFLLTTDDLLSGLPVNETRMIVLDRVMDKILEQNESNVHRNSNPDNLAYVIYTSGSTGKPKGVQICHGSVVNFLESMAQKPGISEDDLLLAVTTLSFDISILELFLPLSVGATVAVASREIASDGNLLGDALSHYSATIMQATPATWRMLFESGWIGNNNLKMLCGGEALSPELATQLLKHGASLWNMYGPTETTIWSSVNQITPDVQEITIGPPISNTEFYVLDPQGQPVPVGIPGELFIGGIGLARGYLGRPELTAERFLIDPFSNRKGGRLYKTGDLVRYLPNGHLEFIGRIDHQVKIRGFRIELGEIEAILSQHPDILMSMVIVREDHPDDKRLTAYFRTDSNKSPSAAELKKYLRNALPEYMVPSFFVQLDDFPLTPNGKIDRNKLPLPTASTTSFEDFVSPSSPMERLIAEIWQEVLGIETISTTDNFFDLGGHSLLAMRAVHEIEKNTGKRIIPRRLVFQTLAEVAAFCESDIASEDKEQSQGLTQKLFSAFKKAVASQS